MKVLKFVSENDEGYLTYYLYNHKLVIEGDPLYHQFESIIEWKVLHTSRLGLVEISEGQYDD